MRTIDVVQAQSERNQCLRLLMLLIIVGTFPFYGFAIFIIGSAPVEIAAAKITQTATPASSFTPLGADQARAPTFTPLAVQPPTQTPQRALPATPAQYVPPTPLPAQTIAAPTVVSPTPIAIVESATPDASPAAGIADADLDGVADEDDRCPNEAGSVENDGCPWSDDSDRDGIRDADDRCPNEFAPDSPRGCRDFDDDGLDTSEDDCPREAGPAANRGCPLEAEAGG